MPSSGKKPNKKKRDNLNNTSSATATSSSSSQRRSTTATRTRSTTPPANKKNVPWDLELETGTATWQSNDIPRLPDGKRYNHAAATLPDGSVVVAGGYLNGSVTNTVWIWAPQSASWTAGPPLQERRTSLALVVCGNRLCAIGGWNGSVRLDTVECLDASVVCGGTQGQEPRTGLSSQSWTTLFCRLSSKRNGCAAVAVSDRHLVVMGGYDGTKYLDTVDLLDTQRNTVQLAPSRMTTARGWFGAAVVDGTIYAVGGEYFGFSTFTLNTVECCDIVVDHTSSRSSKGTWLSGAANSNQELDRAALWRVVPALGLSTGRNSFGLAAVGRRLIVAGGYDGNSSSKSVEVVDTQKGKVWQLPEMGSARDGCAAVALHDGRVAVLGGSGLDSVETLLLVETDYKELYRRALSEGTSEPKQIRALLCGPFGVGKSSVARSLQQLPFEPNLESTQGIDAGGRLDRHQIGSSSALSFRVAVQLWKETHPQRSTAKDETKNGGAIQTLEDPPEYFVSDEKRGDAAFSQSDSQAPAGDSQQPPAKKARAQQTAPQNLQGSADVFELEGVTLMLWDFAGQIAYHSMHQMFFRENCLYVLVLNLQEDSHCVDGDGRKRAIGEEMLRDAQHWLNAVVSSAGPNVRMVIVGTHADHFESKEAAEARLHRLLQKMKDRTCDIDWDEVVRHAETVVVDNKNGVGLDVLQTALITASKKILSNQDMIPLKWLRLLEILDHMELPVGQFFLQLDEILERAFELGFTQEIEVKAALSFFDRVGSVIYVVEEGLDQWVFPEPHRLLDVIKSILAPNATRKQPLEFSRVQWDDYTAKGVIGNQALASLWEHFQHHTQLRMMLARSNLLMDFGNVGVVVPTLLPETIPDFSVVGEGMVIFELQILTECSTHLPPALFPFLLAGMHREHGTEKQELRLMGRTFSALLLNPEKGRWTFPRYVESCYMVLVLDQLQHTVSMTLHLVCQDFTTQQQKEGTELLTEIGVQTTITLHKLAKSRFPWMMLRSMVKTASPCNGTKHKWCLLETNKDGGAPDVHLNCPDFCIFKKNLHSIKDCVLEIKPSESPNSGEVTRKKNGGKARFDSFISHAGEQKLNVALPLHQHLVAQSLTPFIDHENLPTGFYGPDIMEQAMAEAHVGVFILSPEFIAKEWPMKELLCFMERYNDAKANGRSPPLLIPVFHSLSWHDCGLSADDLFDKFKSSFSNPHFKFMERVKCGETSKECVADALKKLKRFTGVENRHGDAQIVRETAEEVQKHLLPTHHGIGKKILLLLFLLLLLLSRL